MMTTFIGTRTLTVTDGFKQTIARRTASGWLVTLRYVDIDWRLPSELCPTDADVIVYCKSENWPSPLAEAVTR